MKKHAPKAIMAIALTLPITCAAQPTLEQRLQQLEQRVQKLEDGTPAQATPRTLPQQSGPLHEVRANWRALRKGMSEEDVRRLLGDADKVDNRGYRTVWYWNYPSGGNVTMDEKGRVTGWSEP